MQRLFLIIYILCFYYTTASTYFAGEVNLDDTENRNKDFKFEQGKKINAVLFLADTSATDGNYSNTSGLDILKLLKKPDLKHCTDDNSIVPRTRRKTHWRFKKNTCSCYGRLQEGILSLMNYAQNTLGMVTALGSLSNHSFSNSIRFGNAEIDVAGRSDVDDERQEKNNDTVSKQGSQEVNETKNDDGQVQVANVSLPAKDEQAFRSVPLWNVFPKDSPPPLYAFTDSEERKRRSQGPYVMEPEHTEVFNIRTKRQLPAQAPREIGDAPYLTKEQKVRTIFDIMDIMNSLQRQLFGNVLEDDSDFYNHNSETCPYQHNIFRRMRQPGLFEVVQKTLYSVINASDTGFLMIIVGGNLSDISSSYSPLVQSIKHVAENTDEDSTLIVLTGTCPNSPDAIQKLPCEELNMKNLPLFAIGPGSEDFSRCYELYDVPITVRNILMRFNANTREAQPQDLEIPMHHRSKRNIMDFDDEAEEEYEEEEEFEYKPRRAAHSTGGSGSTTTKLNQGTHAEKGTNKAISMDYTCFLYILSIFSMGLIKI